MTPGYIQESCINVKTIQVQLSRRQARLKLFLLDCCRKKLFTNETTNTKTPRQKSHQTVQQDTTDEIHMGFDLSQKGPLVPHSQSLETPANAQPRRQSEMGNTAEAPPKVQRRCSSKIIGSWSEMVQSEVGINYLTIMATPPRASAVATLDSTWATDGFINVIENMTVLPLSELLPTMIDEVIQHKRKVVSGKHGNIQIPCSGLNTLRKELCGWRFKSQWDTSES